MLNNNENMSEQLEKKITYERAEWEPSFAYVAASWTALILGLGAYLIGLWNAGMQRNEKG